MSAAEVHQIAERELDPIQAAVAELATVRARVKAAAAEADKVAKVLDELRRQESAHAEAVDAAAGVAGGALVDALLSGGKAPGRADAAAVAALMESRRLAAAVAAAEKRHAALTAEVEGGRNAIKTAVKAVAEAEARATVPALLKAWECYRKAWTTYRAAADAAGWYVSAKVETVIAKNGSRVDLQPISDVLVSEADMLKAMAELQSPILREAGPRVAAGVRSPVLRVPARSCSASAP